MLRRAAIREKKNQMFKDNRSLYISIHYTAPFSITRVVGKSGIDERSACRKTTIDYTGDDLAVFPRCSVFLMHLAVWPLEIQTETTMNHVLIDSTRASVHRLASSSFSFVFECIGEHGEEKRASRLASQNAPTSIRHIVKRAKRAREQNRKKKKKNEKGKGNATLV